MKRFVRTYFVLVIAALLSFFSSVLTNLISNRLENYLVWLVVALIMTVLVYLILKCWQRIKVDIDVEPLRDETAQQQQARRGLIILLPLYRQFPSARKRLSTEQINEAMSAGDYEALELENTSATSFGHAVLAINAHASRLEHLWIITTRSASTGKMQSLTYAPIFAKFIQEKIKRNLTVHWGEEFSVSLDDDAIVCRKTYQLVKEIYQRAKKFSINEKELISDVTGGIRSMVAGAILACLDKDNDIQVIGAKYNETGDPIGEAYPMIIEYKPELIESK